MSRAWKIVIALVGALALVGLISVPGLVRSVLRLKRASVTEEQARRAIIQPSVSTPTDAQEKVQLFLDSATSPGSLEPVTVDIPLSADPEQRGKQLIAALIEKPSSPEQRTLPADVTLLQFYLLADGTAVADFSEVLGTETPSGILSEQLVVDSIVRTLAANMSGVTRLKIMIRGEETDTLAGHLDLTGFFPVSAPAPATPDLAPGVTDALPSPAPAVPAASIPNVGNISAQPSALRPALPSPQTASSTPATASSTH